VLLLTWLCVSELNLVAKYMLPSPLDVIRAFIYDFKLLFGHMLVSLKEAFLGLIISTIFAFIMAVIMDRYEGVYKTVYPLFIISQTIPVIALAPLLVLWLGYGIAPKIFLIVLVCFFPLVIALLEGFKAADRDTMRLMKSMGATQNQILCHIKFPCALGGLFAGLKVSVSYSIIGAVIAEWLGGSQGLGVYMTRVRKSYAFDKMFAVILLISILSLVLMKGVSYLEKKVMPWNNIKN
jgi:ABC-type nitrate/sulfonate/bicarbonate transport system permease component